MEKLTRVTAWLAYCKLAIINAVRRVLADRLSDTISVKDFGAVGDGVTDDTVAIQNGIEALHASGGGTLYFPRGKYIVNQSSLNETYDNDGVPFPANWACVIVKPKVRLLGAGRGSTHLHTPDVASSVVLLVAPNKVAVECMEVSSSFSLSNIGAGHGIFHVNTASGSDKTCSEVKLTDLHIHNVGSYGIGLENGAPRNCYLGNILIEDIGADGVDTKVRGVDIESSGNSMHSITVRNHGMRLDGCTGVDIRGIWNLSGVQVVDFGTSGRTSYTGIRFRTKNDSDLVYVSSAGRRSTLTGFLVRPADTFTGATDGVTSGSDDVTISNGTVVNADSCVIIAGNAIGGADRNIVSGVHAINCKIRGFFIGTGTVRAQVRNCLTYRCGEGFRDNGANTSFIGCTSEEDTTPFASATASSASNYSVGCKFGDDVISLDYITQGRVAVTAKGSSTNIDLVLQPKGTGNLRLGAAFVPAADGPIVGYISIKDSTGAVRRIAVM
ncbi:tail fiber protein [Aeromonas phage vB_AspA_Tola]|nr:tail fiber protein [Aeromonas phage vB_AspA_Tola]